ncbi:alanine racemase [Kribbella sp. NBC_01245]|uniref:alanine racemase n=1 Tax=Kribbella sp. NBC_01245 TaxID=2903578 RepID=UPI002E2DCCA2|nr:alanine racemase [Kribbella sp. NBC_01245]
MPLTLHIDQARWREHLRSTWNESIVPVAKGNGYGVGNARLLAEAAALGAKTVAVGTYEEVPSDPQAEVVVLTPWRPFVRTQVGPNVIHTVSRLADLVSIPARSRVVVEVQTSMRRHGIGARELRHSMLMSSLDRVRFEGWSLHFPMGAGGYAANIREAAELGRQANAVRKGPLWVSHVPATKLGDIGENVRLRMGTGLWLGDRGALTVRATVLDVHSVRRGERVGYRQRRVAGDGHILVVSGGTAHGVGMEAPTAAATVRQRTIALAKGGLDAAGMALSPFTIDGKQRWFAEPPHMQASMLYLPSSVTPPHIGDEVGVDVRFTTTLFDQIVMD